MAHIGFVSTSVLESKDGIGFNEEVRKESEEVLEAERIAKEADKKPLWEQLAGKRDEKQAKFDAVRASMFAPPRALDDEESNFLQGVEAQRVEARQRKDDWEAEELRGFALARANQTVAIAEPKKPKARPSIDGALGGDEDHQQQQRQQQKEGRTGAPPPVVAIKIKAKRKKGKDKDKGEKRAKKRASTSASSTEEVVAHSDIASGKGGEIDRNADGKTDGKAKSDGKSGGGSGDALETPGKAKGKIEGMGALSGGGGGGRDGDGDGDGDAKDKESGGANLSSLLGAYGSDSDSGGGDA